MGATQGCESGWTYNDCCLISKLILVSVFKGVCEHLRKPKLYDLPLLCITICGLRTCDLRTETAPGSEDAVQNFSISHCADGTRKQEECIIISEVLSCDAGEEK